VTSVSVEGPEEPGAGVGTVGAGLKEFPLDAPEVVYVKPSPDGGWQMTEAHVVRTTDNVVAADPKSPEKLMVE
jgi:hypothetical protein